jgi:peptidoglycan/LPS O-acetylase OafA/YrhL
LDGVRGIAAILVLLEHWRNAFFVDFPQLQSYRAPLSVLYLLCAAGHQAVVVFFVLSGYLISGSILRAFHRKDWNWTQYLIHRLVRLWIVLLPALILGGCWDQLGIHLHQAPALYAGANYNHITADVRQTLSLGDFLGNATFMQTIMVPTFGSNSALWSLANEFWYYILFPLGACLVVRLYSKPSHVVMCSFALCVVAACVTRYLLLFFPIWLLGALLHAFPRKPTTFWSRIVAAAAYIAVFFGISILDRQSWHMPRVASDLILGIATVWFLRVLLGAVQAPKATIACGISRWTARFSFTLYVSHTPMLVLLAAFVAHDTRWTFTMKTGSVAVCALIFTVAYAWLLAAATEFRTDNVREWVEGKICGGRPNASH